MKYAHTGKGPDVARTMEGKMSDARRSRNMPWALGSLVRQGKGDWETGA